jgi:hypothetical protein
MKSDMYTHPQPEVISTPDETRDSPFEQGNFLSVSGGLDAEGRFAVEPGFIVDYRRRIPYAEIDENALKEAVILELLDEQGELLTQCPLPLFPACMFGAVDPGLRMFAAAVSVPQNFHFIRYYVGDRLLKELQKPDPPPVVKFIQTPNATAMDEEEIRWEVGRHGDSDIRSIVLFSHDDGRSWQPIVPPSSNPLNSVPVRFANLPGGKARLRVMATDGFSTATMESESFDVPVKGVRPTILSPAEGAVVSTESPTWFYGQAYDYEKRDAAPDELIWCSSRDGELGRGQVIAFKLSPGLHEVTLKCCGAAVSISIVAQPYREPAQQPAGCGCE